MKTFAKGIKGRFELIEETIRKHELRTKEIEFFFNKNKKMNKDEHFKGLMRHQGVLEGKERKGGKENIQVMNIQIFK